MLSEHSGKSIAGKISELAFAFFRQRVKLAQFVIDKARMAHHDAAVRQAIEEAWKNFRKVGSAAETVGAREGRVGSNPKCACPAAESSAQNVEKQTFWVEQFLRRRQDVAALAYPRS